MIYSLPKYTWQNVEQYAILGKKKVEKKMLFTNADVNGQLKNGSNVIVQM